MRYSILVLEKAERDALRIVDVYRAEADAAREALRKAEEGEASASDKLADARVALAAIRASAAYQEAA